MLFCIVWCYKIYYNEFASDPSISSRLIKWGTILYTTDIESIADIMGDDFMAKEDKKRFVEVANSLNEKYNNFTQEQLEQLMEFKLEGERLAGYEEGCAFGVAEGLAETARNMLKENIDIELIIKVTGLAKEEIMKLKETL